MPSRTTSKRAQEHLYLLTTALYYPATLGAIFFFALSDMVAGVSGANIPLFLGYGGIVLTFSIDFLYSVSARAYYSASLFVSDLLILGLMVSAYTSLLEGLRGNGDFFRFYLSFGLIHAIFLCWDGWLARQSGGSRRPMLLAYDALGFMAAALGILLFRSSIAGALSLLWVCGVLYLLLGWPAIRTELLRRS